MLDLGLIKLQYEILNKSVKQIADETGMPENLIEKEIKDAGWKQWWPEDVDQRLLAKQTEDIGEDEVLALQSEQFIDRAKRRLAAYTLAKEIYLAQKYLKLESALIDKAHTILETLQDGDSRSAKELSALYKDMTSKSPMGALASFSFGEDEGGIPVVTIRDLSGRK